MTKYFLIALVIFGTAFLWLNRYQMYPAGDETAYKLDRWTGNVTRFVGAREIDTVWIERKKETSYPKYPSAPEAPPAPAATPPNFR